ncbi:MAG: O-antigen ligase family protein [Kineosporiaceae bacterium]
MTSRPLLAVLAVALMIGSDLKVRVRDPTSAVSGQLDAAVLVEIALFAAVAALVIGLYPARLPSPGRITLVQGLTALFVADLLLSAVYSPFPALAAVRMAELLVWAALAVRLGDIGGLPTLHRVAHGYIVAATAAVGVGIAFRRPAVGLEPDRFSWLSVHPVVAASWLGISAVLLLSYLLTGAQPHGGRIWHPNVYLLLFTVHVAALIATHTRGALAGFVAAALTVIAGRVSLRRRAEFLVIGTALVVVTWLIAATPLREYLARGESAARLATLNGRTQLWELSWAPAQDRLWFGMASPPHAGCSSTGPASAGRTTPCRTSWSIRGSSACSST